MRKLFSELKSKCKTKSQMIAFNNIVKTFGFFDPSIKYNGDSIEIDGKEFTDFSDLYKYCKSKKYKYLNTPTKDGFGVQHVTGYLEKDHLVISMREEDHMVDSSYDSVEGLIEDCDRRLSVDAIYVM